MEISIYNNPDAATLQQLLRRNAKGVDDIADTVRSIMDEVKQRGDEALFELERRFDCPSLSDLTVSDSEFDEAERLVDDSLKAAIKVAESNIRKFHAAQLMTPIEVETTPGVVCRQKAVAIRNVGLYVPGGNAPLFSTVLMLAVPANIAGCANVVLCTPPGKDGKVNPAILVAARLAGVDKVYKVGGAQAIAAMAYGTATVPHVNKIFGPGNRFVMVAKQLAQVSDVAIDMPAGPSEVMIVADDAANPTFVAADFLSQSEHGPDSQSILVTTSSRLASAVASEVNTLLHRLPRQEHIKQSLSKSSIIVVGSDDEMMAVANQYAPEHLIINHNDAERLAGAVENAGSVFLGQYACESAGDYASGTNHTLPTSGYAHAYSGVNIDSFTKKITFQSITAKGIATLGPVIETLAEGESLDAHKLAATVRIEQVNAQK